MNITPEKKMCEELAELSSTFEGGCFLHCLIVLVVGDCEATFLARASEVAGRMPCSRLACGHRLSECCTCTVPECDGGEVVEGCRTFDVEEQQV